MSATHICPQIALTKVRPSASLNITGHKTPKLTTRVLVPLQTRMDRIQSGVSLSEEVNVPVQASHLGRRVEKDILESPQPLVMSLKFERFPIWLLTLDSMQITEVHFMGFSAQEALNSHIYRPLFWHCNMLLRYCDIARPFLSQNFRDFPELCQLCARTMYKIPEYKPY
jgi:hypothetical protein